MKKILFFLMMGLTLTACLGPVKAPPKAMFTLAVPEQVGSRSKSHGQVLLVSQPVAAPGYQSTDMIYTQHPYELKSYTRNRWVAAPANMLLPLLVQNIASSGCFRAVVSSPFSGLADLSLDSNILALQQDFFMNGPSRVRFALQVDLINNATQQVVAHRVFESIVIARENTPYGGVVAANQAVANVLGEVRRFVCLK